MEMQFNGRDPISWVQRDVDPQQNGSHTCSSGDLSMKMHFSRRTQYTWMQHDIDPAGCQQMGCQYREQTKRSFQEHTLADATSVQKIAGCQD